MKPSQPLRSHDISLYWRRVEKNRIASDFDVALKGRDGRPAVRREVSKMDAGTLPSQELELPTERMSENSLVLRRCLSS